MDKFVTITKSNLSGKVVAEKEKHKLRFNPYGAKEVDAQKARDDWIAKGKEQRYLAAHSRSRADLNDYIEFWRVYAKARITMNSNQRQPTRMLPL